MDDGPGWERAALGELLQLEYGDGLTQADRTGQGYPVYGSSGQIGNHSQSLVEGPGIIVGRKGTVGAVVWSSEDFWPIDTTYYVRPTRQVNLRWLYWLLLNSDLDQLDASTGVPGLNRYEAYSLKVPIPPLREQRRIAEILDTVDEAIRETERVIAKLRQVKQGLLHDLLTRGLDAAGRLRDPEAHPEAFKDSPLGRIPREWRIVTIGDLAVHVGSGATPRGGSEVYQTEGIVFVRSQNVDFNGLNLADVAYISEAIHRDMANSEIHPWDTLINITGASIGRCYFVPEWLGPANVNQHVCAIRLSHPTRSDAVYLSSVLSSDIGQHQVEVLNAGSNRQGLNYSQLRSFVVPWSDLEERVRIAAVLDAHDARIRAEEGGLAKRRQVKEGLMDDLLTGKVRV
jgi:type I restriction enzyme S subunit